MDKSKLVVTYEAFGAVGDGKTDDVPAIYQAHEFANNENLPVKARYVKKIRFLCCITFGYGCKQF
ncbi:MAG: hypothetical protein GX230_05160 [Lentisphaerae bacterium]|nr:hypothetical protein [Lentisphaerota bacterium]